ncbi:MAG: hypothetical protein ACWGQW_05925 [bacterium]
MADFALDEVMDAEDERTEFRTGNMPLHEAIERGVVDESGAECGPGHVCFCGDYMHGHGQSDNHVPRCMDCELPEEKFMPAKEHPSISHVLKFFKFGHLPEDLQKISKQCSDLAHNMVMDCKQSPELTVGLRKLLEAKDCFVRARLEMKEEESSS